MDTEAVVLRRFDFGETSQVGHLYTRELGRLSVLAKGIKRPGPELQGPMDLPARAAVRVVQRPRSELDLLTRYRVVTGHPGLRRSAPRLFAAMYVSEVLRQGTRDLDPDPALYDHTVAVLEALDGAAPEEIGPLVAAYELGYLARAGFLPDFGRCTSCGRPAPESGAVRFSPARGGLVCRGCSPRAGGGLVVLEPVVREVLRVLTRDPSPDRARELRPDPGARRLLRRLLPALLERTFEHELRAAPFVRA